MQFVRRSLLRSLWLGTSLVVCVGARGDISPNEIDDLKLWLRPETLSSLRGGTPVESWEDQSDAKAHAVQKDQDHRPTAVEKAIGNLNALHFDGLKQYFLLPKKSVLSFVADFAFFMVFRPTNPAKQGYETIFGAGVRGDNPLVGLQNSSPLFYSLNVNPANVSANVRLNRGDWHLVELHKDIDQIDFYVNRDLAGTYLFNNPACEIANPWRGIGCGDSVDECFEGDLAELVVYDRAISSEERRQLSCALAKKYQLNAKGC